MLHLLAQKLTELGLLQCAPDGLTPNAKAYLKPKSAQKCAFIVNMIRVNDHCLPPPPFQLPQLDNLTHTITLALLRGTPLYFTKLDISNMFWSCKIPPQFQHTIRIGVRGQVFSFHGLPQHLVQHFKQHNWVVSTKSELEPTHHITWMGKHFNVAVGSVPSDPVYIVGIIMLWVTLATHEYRHKYLHRLLGKLQWALRPGRGAAPFLAGPYSWLHQGPTESKCTPTLVLRALAEAIAAALVPWTAPQVVPCGPTWFVGAAGTHSGYWSAIWSPYLRPKIVHHPPWVQTQQAAELAGVIHAIKVAAYQGHTTLNLVIDNQAAIASVITGKATYRCPAQQRLLRELHHVLRWSGLQITCYWLPGVFNPVDPPSRWWKYGTLYPPCKPPPPLQSPPPPPGRPSLPCFSS